ncbi:MAG: hypothetical protein NWF09_03115 [Candidatus Bathyarchaeota archaeon]|nr:hypothetical protein [Candidatus Bathyarchaeota archaeon]
MNRKLGLLTALLAVSFIVSTAVAAILVGVKKGDWIEYRAVFTGTPPAGHEVTWARTEVLDVQGTIIDLNVTTKFANGTLWHETITLNLATGQLGDEFIIPADLNVGDTFFDKYHGNITISKIEKRTYAGATRTVISATAAQSTYYWDQATGVLVEGISEFPDYTIHSIVEKTNMWQAQIFGLEPTVFYALLILATIIIVVALAFLAIRRRKKH